MNALMLRNAGPREAVLLIVQASILVLLITFLERRGRRSTGAGVVPSGLSAIISP